MREAGLLCRRAGLLALWVAVFGVLFAHAWVHEDNYITFRVIDNLLHGYGLRWNVDERVQVFTHPLWLWLNLPFYAACGAPECSVLLSSSLCVALMLWALWRAWRGQWVLMLLYAACLTGSAVFRDYLFSGFETPLLFALATGFILWFRHGTGGVWVPSLLAALSMVTRLDTALLYLPALAYVFLRAGWKDRIRMMVVGAPPLLLWFGFSTFYYGFPLPNTAYAKIPANYPYDLFLAAGKDYVLSLPLFSPAAAWLAVFGLAAAFGAAARERGRAAPFLVLAAGAVLYGGYVVSVGGDYMAGRLWAPPIYWLMLASLCFLPSRRWHYVLAAGLCLSWGAQAVMEPYETYRVRHALKIWDERSFRLPLCLFCDAKIPRHEREWALQGLRHREAARKLKADQPQARFVVNEGSVGEMGYMAGPEVIMIDRLALGDAFLARQRAVIPDRDKLMAGHYVRLVSVGYMEARRTGDSSHMNSMQRLEYEALRRLTQEPLWSWERLRAIVRFNLGI